MFIDHLDHRCRSDCVAFARQIVIPAGPGFLAETPELAQQIGCLAVFHAWLFLIAPLAYCPADIVAGQVAHAERAHRKAESLNRFIDLLGRAAFFKQKPGLAAVLLDHPITDEAVADARDDRGLADFFAQRHHGCQHVFSSLFGAHNFKQPHHVGRAEKVRADHVLRPFREAGNFVHVERRGIRREDGTGLHHAVQLVEDFLLDAQLLEHCLDHHVGVFQIVVAQRGAEQGHAFVVFALLELAFFDLRLVVFANRGDAAVQRVLLHLQHLDRNAGVQKIHRNAAAHGASADHRYRLDLALRRIGRNVGNLGRCALGHEEMTQCPALRREHQIGKQFALKGHAIVEFAFGGGFDCIDAFERCGQVLRHALDHVAGKLEIRLTVWVLARQVAHLRQGPGVCNRLRKSQRFIGKRFSGRSHFVKQLLTGNLRQKLAFDRLATDDHVECRLDAERARQTLCATRARQQPELDFGQRDRAAGRGDPVMATQRQLQPAAHAHRMDCRDDRFGRVLDGQNDAKQIRLGHGFCGAEFLDVGPAGKRLARASDDDGLDRRIGVGFLQVVRQA